MTEPFNTTAQLTKTAAPLGDLLSKLLSRGGAKALPATEAVAAKAKSLLSRVSGAAIGRPVQSLGQLPGAVGRFAAGASPTGAIRPKHVAKALLSPNIPFLTRAPASTGMELPRFNPQARFADKTRQFAGNAIRAGSGASLAGSAALGGSYLHHGLSNELATDIGESIKSVSPISVAEREQLAKSIQREAIIPGLMGTVGAGSSQEPVTRAAARTGSQLWLPLLRNTLYTSQKSIPKYHNAADTVRSFSPFGAAVTAVKRFAASSVRPNVGKALAKNLLEEHLGNGSWLRAKAQLAATMPLTAAAITAKEDLLRHKVDTLSPEQLMAEINSMQSAYLPRARDAMAPIDTAVARGGAAIEDALKNPGASLDNVKTKVQTTAGELRDKLPDNFDTAKEHAEAYLREKWNNRPPAHNPFPIQFPPLHPTTDAPAPELEKQQSDAHTEQPVLDPFNVVAKFAEWDATSEANRDAALADLPKMLALGLGAGGAARSSTGLLQLLERKLRPTRPSYPGAVVTNIPIPVDDDEEKQAASDAPTRSDINWYWPAMTALGLGGVYGGWKGMDAILDRRRSKDHDEELEKAKADFESAMLSSARPRKSFKLASDANGLSEMLDTIYDKLQEKRAVSLLGAYGGYAAVTGLPAALLAFKAARKRSKRKIMDKAMARRLHRVYAANPSEMITVPMSVAMPKPVSLQDNEKALAAIANESADDVVDNDALIPKV